MKTFRRQFSRAGARVPYRHGTVLLLLFVLVLEFLPFALPSVDSFFSCSTKDSPSFVEPLQICDDGQGFTAFVADHPWLPGDGVFFLSRVVRLAFAAPSEGTLSSGFSPPVYRPPRPSAT